MNYEKTIILRLTKKDYDKIKVDALIAKLSVSEYMRRIIKES